MDFSSILAKEIAKKKAEAQASKSSSSNTSKYITKAQLEKNREEAYFKEQQEKQEKQKKRQLQLQEEKERELQENKKKKLNRVEKSSPSSIPTNSDIISRLRKLNEPITLFAESDKARYNRLIRLEKQISQSNLILKEKEEDAKTNPIIVPQDIKDDQQKVYIQMRVYLKQLLSNWNSYLQSNPDESNSIYKETVKDIEILFNHLRNKDLPQQIFPSLATLLLNLQNKNYLQANNTYIQLSIGNAAWPIGVIGVAIHERSAQSKITGIHNSNNPSLQTAHIMSNENSRRWLTAIKRIITFCENHEHT